MKKSLHKISKYFGSVLILLSIGYLLFPLWFPWVIQSNLPANVELVSLESDYPGFKRITIKKLELAIDEDKILIRDLSLHYDLSDIQIDRLTVYVHSSEPLEPADDVNSDAKIIVAGIQFLSKNGFVLPVLSSQDFQKLEILQKLNISHISVIRQKPLIEFSNFRLTRDEKSGPGNISSNSPDLEPFRYLIDFSPHIGTPHKTENGGDLTLNIQLLIDAPQHKITLQLTKQQQQIVSLSHQVSNKQTIVEAGINVEKILELLQIDSAALPFRLLEPLKIHWSQNTKQTQVSFFSTVNFLPDFSGFSELNITSIVEQSSQKTLLRSEFPNRGVTLPLEISIISQLEQPLNALINIKSKLNQSLVLINKPILITLKGVEFDFSTNLALADNLNNHIIKIDGTKLNLIGNSLHSAGSGATIELADYRVNASFDNILLNLEKLNLNQIKWRLKGELSSQSMISNFSSTNKSNNVNQKQQDGIHFSSGLFGNFEIIKEQNVITSGEIQFNDFQLEHPKYSLSGLIRSDWKEMRTDLSAGDLNFQLKSNNNRLLDFDFDSLEANANLVIDEKTLKGKGRVLINQQALAPYTFSFDKQSSSLSLELIKNQLANQVMNHFLAIIGERNKIALEILDGEIVHSAAINIGKKMAVGSKFAIKNMLFRFGDNQIQGLNLSQTVYSIEPFKFESRLNIKKVEFSSGLTVENIAASMTSSSINNISIKQVKGELLQGKLLSEEIKFDSDGLLESIIQLKQISITELIFMMDIAGLYAEGKLDITVPLSMRSGQIIVKNGSFKAIGEGILKYTTGQSEQEIEGNVALQALQNFHYKELDGTLSYNHTGDYHIKLHLLGANPDLYDGYPIDFVVNLRGKLSSIFRSLFLTGNFEQAVMEQVKADSSEPE